MDIEKAIWQLESCLMCDVCSTCALHDKVIEFALDVLKENTALREAVEQKGKKLYAAQKLVKEMQKELAES